MFIEVKTGYLHKGVNIDKYQKILKRYRDEFLLYDTIPLVTLIYNFFYRDTSTMTKIVEFLIFFKVVTCLKHVSTLKEKIKLYGTSLAKYTLLSLFFYFICFAHFFACIFNYLQMK